MWHLVNKKLLKWEKAKIILFIQSLFCLLFFCEKVSFLTGPAQNCNHCGQFDIGVTICVWWLATPPN